MRRVFCLLRSCLATFETAYVLLGPPMRYALPAFLGAQAIKNLYLKGASYYVAQNHVGEDGGMVQNLNTPRIPGAAFPLLQSQQGRSLADCVSLAEDAVVGSLADARELLATAQRPTVQGPLAMRH
jgi:hypothetical protein